MPRFIMSFCCTITLLSVGAAQQPWDCPPRTVINNGVCLNENGKWNNCSSRESPLCYDVDPQYTDEAAEANVKGIVVVAATVGIDGCAHDIRVVRRLGYGLDEAAVGALERYRFRRRPKPYAMNVEFKFDPKDSSRSPVTAPECEEVVRNSSKK